MKKDKGNNRYNPGEKKTSIKNSVGRLLLILLMLILQLYWLILTVGKLSRQYPVIEGIVTIFALMLVIAINENETTTALKMPMMTVILLVPLVGVLLFLLIELGSNTKSMQKRFDRVKGTMTPFLDADEKIIDDIAAKDKAIAGEFKYLKNICGFPAYDDTSVRYYKDPNSSLCDQIEDIKNARRFIFIEYHAIEDKESFGEMKEALAKKASEGVDVRVLYDDIGSFVFISRSFIKQLESLGIKCRAFNPMMPFFNLFINNRDHRKITVVDGKVGYTGGFNLANEYFNITSPYGHWKDSGLRLEGSAVNSLTAMFLEMWHSTFKKDLQEDISVFFTRDASPVTAGGYRGFTAPFADSPLDNEFTGENMFINLINNTEDYIWFVTPYLIVSDELKRALILAAKRGVDVRIIIPGVPDKRIIYKVTCSYIGELVREGVSIYTYTPGFCHAKMCLSDGDTAFCGTINMDYRSLHHHFEDGVLFYDCEACGDMKKDFEELFDQSEDISIRYNRKRRGPVRVGQSLLRFIAPFV